jgi:hypothetical protein
MNTTKLISPSGALLGLTIAVLSFLLVPERLNGSVTASVTLWVLVASFTFRHLSAVLVSRQARMDERSLAIMAPTATLGHWVITVAAVGFVAALLGAWQFAIAADVIAIMVLLAGSLFLRVAMDQLHSMPTTDAEQSPPGDWRGGLALAARQAVLAQHRMKLAALEERADCIASDTYATFAQDGALDTAVAALADAAARGDENAFAEAVRYFENLMAQRELSLKLELAGAELDILRNTNS